MVRQIQRKKCLYCKKDFSTKWSFQKYCCNNCENKSWTRRVNYNQRPEVKNRLREWSKKYNQRPEVKNRLRKIRFCKICNIELTGTHRKIFCSKCKPIKIKKIRYCKICNGLLDNKNKSYCSECKSKDSFKEYQRQVVNNCAKKWYRKPGKKELIYSYLKKYKKENKANFNSKNNSRKRTIESYNRAVYRRNEGLMEKNSLFMEKICKQCGSKVYVQFHHEVYPSTVKEIKKAIEEGKIYFLCRKCHGKLRRK